MEEKMKINFKKLTTCFLCSLLVLTAFPVLAIGASAAGIAADAAVPAFYLDGSKGADTNDGKTPEKAVATLNGAIALANATTASKVVVVVSGPTSLGSEEHNILTANTPRIILTSFYNNVDYRTTGAILNSPTVAKVDLLYFNGDFTFEHLKFQMMATNFIFAMQYNDLLVGSDVEILPLAGGTAATAYPILIAGCNGAGSVYTPVDKAIGDPTFTDNVTIEINSGDWQYYRGGDRDTQTTFNGTLTTTINGGKFHQESTGTSYKTNSNNVSATGKGNYGPDAKIVLNLKGGEMQNVIGYNYVQPYTPKNESKADITINIYPGVKITGYVAATQANNGIFNGKVTINVYGGDLSTLIESVLTNNTVDDTDTGKVYVNYKPSDPASVAAYQALIKNTNSEGCVFGEIADAPASTTAPAATTAAPAATTAPGAPATTAGSGSTSPSTLDSTAVIFILAACTACAAVLTIRKARKEN